MTGKEVDSDILGSVLPGDLLLPSWRVKITRRGSGIALEWEVATSPAAADQLGRDFVSLPRPYQRRRGSLRSEYLRPSSHRRSSRQLADLEQLIAAFRTHGQAAELRQMRRGVVPPFGGGYGVLDDFITLAE